MSTLLNSDLLLVNRNDVTFKLLASDLNPGSSPIQPDRNQILFSPSVPGSGTLTDPYVLSPGLCLFGQSILSNEEITIIEQEPGQIVSFEDVATGNDIRFQQPLSIIPVDGSEYKKRFVFTDTPQSTVTRDYTGLLKLTDTDIYFEWTVTVEPAAFAPILNSVDLIATGDGSNRFQNQSFKATLDITEGKPVSEKFIGYKVTGNLFDRAESDVITEATNTLVPGKWDSFSVSAQLPATTGLIRTNTGRIIGWGPMNSAFGQTNLGIAYTDDASSDNWIYIANVFNNKQFIYGMFSDQPSGNILTWVRNSSERNLYRPYYSTNDGITWTEGSYYSDNGLYTQGFLCFASAERNDNERYVTAWRANGSKRNFYRSADGVNWALVQNNSIDSLTCKDMAYSPDLDIWVYIGQYDSAGYVEGSVKDDWTHLELTDMPYDDYISWQSVEWGNGVFVAVSGTDTMWSDDGKTWNLIDPATYPTTNPIGWYLKFENGKFWQLNGYTSDPDNVWSSIDGKVWIDANPAGTPGIKDIVWDPSIDKYVGLAYDSYALSSSGGWNVSQSTLKVNSEKDLDDFIIDDPVIQSDGQASGFVDNVLKNGSNSSITVTNSQGTWSANTDKVILGPPQLSSGIITRYLNVDNTRTVTRISEDPVYLVTTNVEDEINFNSNPATGGDWDFELPAGTSIQAVAFADNTSGGGARSPASGTIDSSLVQPNSIYYRGLTQDEFNRLVVGFETYEFRKDKYMLNISNLESDLRNDLLSQGYSIELIDEIITES